MKCMYIICLFLFIFSQNNIYTNNSIEKRCKKNSLIFLHLRIFIISIKLCLNCICVFPLFYLQIYASMPASSSIFFLNPWLKIAITRPTPITAGNIMEYKIAGLIKSYLVSIQCISIRYISTRIE